MDDYQETEIERALKLILVAYRHIWENLVPMPEDGEKAAFDDLSEVINARDVLERSRRHRSI